MANNGVWRRMASQPASENVAISQPSKSMKYAEKVSLAAMALN